MRIDDQVARKKEGSDIERTHLDHLSSLHIRRDKEKTVRKNQSRD